MNVAFWFGSLVAFLGACVSVPQTVRLLRKRDVAGMSITSYVAWTLSWALWVGYSMSVHAWPKASSEALGFVMESTLLVVLLTVTGRPAVARFGRALLLASPGVASVVASGFLFGPVGFAVALSAFDAIYLLPQIRSVLVAPSLSGLSLWSYGLRALTAAGWIAYGFALGRPEVGGWGYVIAPFATFVTYRIVRSRLGDRVVPEHEIADPQPA